MRFSMVLAAALPMAFAAPAHAAYERVQFSGQVLATNPGVPPAFAVGTPITFEAIYDTGKLVDRTQTINDDTGLGFSSVFTGSLADDPKASLSIRIGATSFTKFDEVNYGTPEGDCGTGCDLGGGDFPVVTFLNGSFSGIGNLFVNAAGYSLDADPIADAFGGFDLGDGSGGYDFFLGRSIAGDPFAQTLAVGDFDASSAIFTSVPEPSTWMLLIGGLGVVGLARRRKAERGAKLLSAAA